MSLLQLPTQAHKLSVRSPPRYEPLRRPVQTIPMLVRGRDEEEAAAAALPDTRLGLSGVTIGTLLLTPDTGNAVLAFRVSEQTRKRFVELYLNFLLAFAGAALTAIIGGVAQQVQMGIPNETILVAYSVALPLLAAVIVVSTLPIRLGRQSRKTAVGERPKDGREGIKRLSLRARVQLARLETKAVPASIGVALFLVGTALQFVVLATAHTTAHR